MHRCAAAPPRCTAVRAVAPLSGLAVRVTLILSVQTAVHRVDMGGAYARPQLHAPNVVFPPAAAPQRQGLPRKIATTFSLPCMCYNHCGPSPSSPSLDWRGRGLVRLSVLLLRVRRRIRLLRLPHGDQVQRQPGARGPVRPGSKSRPDCAAGRPILMPSTTTGAAAASPADSAATSGASAPPALRRPARAGSSRRRASWRVV